MTEIVHAAGPEQGRLELFTCARWPPRAPHQGRHPSSQRRVQPLDIRGVDAPQPHLRHLHQLFGPRQEVLARLGRLGVLSAPRPQAVGEAGART